MKKENINSSIQDPERKSELVSYVKFLAVSTAIFGLFVYGLESLYDSQNNLELAKNNRNKPLEGEICDLSDSDLSDSLLLDSACWYQTTRDLCDGNNTLNRNDDVCENITYWEYRPAINYMR